MKDYKVYILDFDGTLFDSLDSLVYVYNAGFNYLGYSIDKKEASIYMHVSLEECCELAHVPIDKRYEFGTRIGQALLSEQALKEIHPFSDTVAVLRELQKRGKKLLIATGNTQEHVAAVLSNHALDDVFAGIFSGVMYAPKPKPDILLEAMKVYPELKKEDFVYIGDSLQDPLTAHNAGIHGVLLDRHDEYSDYEGEMIHSLYDVIK